LDSRVEWLLSAEGRLAIAVLGALALFSWIYDRWVGSLEREGKDRGYMGLIVAFGCAVTIAGFVMWTGRLQAAGQVLVCFVASGSFMILGSIRRYVRSRAQEERGAQAEAREMLDDAQG